MSWYTIAWVDGGVSMLDQRRLPTEEVYTHYRTVEGVCAAIRDMVIRGAPAIGIAAAYGVAVAALGVAAQGHRGREALAPTLEAAIKALGATRPTAVNLFWALDRMRRRWQAIGEGSVEVVGAGLLAEAKAIHAEDVSICDGIGKHGAALIKRGARILTHCNAGALATAGTGTATAIIREADALGLGIRVWADETRPYLQGARLTSWELHRDGIDVTVIADSAAGYMMSQGLVDCVIVGSDRTVANGDVANKIGTYPLAVLCREHGIPFYAAVPISTIDLSLATGAEIPIEERPRAEVANFAGTPTVPAGVPVRNPAFDVTPAGFVTAIVTERGVARPPYSESLRRLVHWQDPT